jgi:glutamate racemase
VLARRKLQSSIRSEQELKHHLPDFVPVLAVVPAMLTAQETRRSARIRRTLATLATVACLLEAVVLWKIHPHL